jgi:hypothetical protein
VLFSPGKRLQSTTKPFAPQVAPEILKRWLELEKNIFVKLVWGWQGM